MKLCDLLEERENALVAGAIYKLWKDRKTVVFDFDTTGWLDTIGDSRIEGPVKVATNYGDTYFGFLYQSDQWNEFTNSLTDMSFDMDASADDFLTVNKQPDGTYRVQNQ